MKLRGAIFDMDGTMLDSMPIWDTLGEQYLRSKGVEPQHGLSRRLISLSMKDTAEIFAREYGIAGSKEEIVAEVDALVEDFYRNTAPLKEGVLDFLEMLRGQGVRMAVATATDRPLAEAAMARVGILPYFEGIVTCTEVGAGKEHPDVFGAALAMLGTDKAETVIFEDALYAVRTAAAAGYRVYGLHDASSVGDEAELEALCELYMKSFADWRE